MKKMTISTETAKGPVRSSSQAVTKKTNGLLVHSNYLQGL